MAQKKGIEEEAIKQDTQIVYNGMQCWTVKLSFSLFFLSLTIFHFIGMHDIDFSKPFPNIQKKMYLLYDHQINDTKMKYSPSY